jgi:signal peptidase II
MAEALREDGVTKLPLWSALAPLTLALAALVFGLDQTHKWWMLNVYDIAGRQPVPVASFFELVLTWNTGISYGLLRTHQQGLLVALSLGVSLVLWSWACRSRGLATVAALAMVIGGALSNALDRAVHGAVADFFHFHVGSFSWYVFNIADMAIVAGVAVLLYESVFEKGHAGNHGNA